MKIVYCLHSTFNSGGMERIVIDKVNYLVEKGCEVFIITTEQNGRKPFYDIAPTVKCIDININYAFDNGSIFKKAIFYYLRNLKHRIKLTYILKEINPDITISTFGNEVTFLHKIKYGGKKILEIHFSKYFRLQRNRKGVGKCIDFYRTREDERLVRKYDSFVVLTEEDKQYWGDLTNMVVIPNFISSIGRQAELNGKTCLAVGRLSYQKGYDRLVRAWSVVHEKYPDWHLQIYGAGEMHDSIQKLIDDLGLEKVITINRPTNQIDKVYVNASVFLLSSYYEGLPMVLLESFSHGVPAVSFDCKCGPKDIIKDGVNGFLVPNGDIKTYADKVIQLISDDAMRKKMGNAAYKTSFNFLKDKIMEEWMNLFYKKSVS